MNESEKPALNVRWAKVRALAAKASPEVRKVVALKFAMMRQYEQEQRERELQKQSLLARDAEG